MRQKFSWKIYRVLDQNSRASVRVVRRDQISRIKKYKKMSRNFSSKRFGRWIKSSVISNMLFLSFHIFMRFEVIEKRWFSTSVTDHREAWVRGKLEMDQWRPRDRILGRWRRGDISQNKSRICRKRKVF